MAKGDPHHIVDVFKETGVKVPKKQQRAALRDAADYIHEQILSNCGEGKTSVEGGKWKRRLSPEYKKRKAEESTATFANLELEGDLLDSLTVKPADGKIEIQVSDDQRDKAEGNLLGSYGRAPDASKAREFMPHARGQKLTKEIMEGVADILREYAEED